MHFHSRTDSRLAVLVVLIAAACALSCCTGEAPPCVTVIRMVHPCMAYLTDKRWTPYGWCCHRLEALNRTATTWEDRVAICECLKSAAARSPSIDPARAAVLPTACGLQLNVTINPFLGYLDCSSIPQV